MQQIRRIVIVGGGSAGWMAAAYLRRALSMAVEITLVESPKVGIIGVGEGTIPTIRDFIQFLALDERDWMTKCQATFKLGIRFDDWFAPGHWWWHPFYFRHPQFEEKQIVDAWLYHRQQGHAPLQKRESLRDGCMSWQLAKGNRCPRFLASFGDFEQWHSDHAYHFDAALFGQYLKQHVAVPAGVRTIVDHVNGTQVDANGFLQSIATEHHGAIEGDLFLDCTGFGRLLTGAISDAAFESYGTELMCDRAVTMAVPYHSRREEMRSYTLSTALSSGWVWQIGLFHRLGVGYVYCSGHLDDDAAEQELRVFLGQERVGQVEARRIRFEAGRLRASWVKNCVAVGLSEGFVEPLEATALGVTQHNIQRIGQILAHAPAPVDPREIEDYNTRVARLYDEIKQFLVSHYSLTQRTDTPFWRDVGKLASPLREVRRRGLPTIPAEMIGAAVFAPQSWVCLAAGMDCLPLAPGDLSQPSTLTLDDLIAAQQSQQRVLPGFVRQIDYLEHLHAG